MPRKSRKTKQKETIDAQIEGMKPFFTAEELHGAVMRVDPSIGIATIYRSLKNRYGRRELHSYRCEGRNIYSAERRNHAHFICKICGATTHFELGDIGSIKKAVDGEICHLQLDVYGICKKCQKARAAHESCR